MKTVPVSGVWIRTKIYHVKGIAQFDKIEVLVEHGGGWKLIQEHTVGYGPISHITEPRGIENSKADESTVS